MSKVQTISISKNIRNPEGRIRKINQCCVFRRSNWIRGEWADKANKDSHKKPLIVGPIFSDQLY